MSGPQIVKWPIESEYSWFASLGDAIAEIGYEPFSYKLCEERAPETPCTETLDDHLRELLSVMIGSWDGEAEARIVTSAVVQLSLLVLAAALREAAEENKLWYPVGELLDYTPPEEEE